MTNFSEIQMTNYTFSTLAQIIAITYWFNKQNKKGKMFLKENKLEKKMTNIINRNAFDLYTNNLIEEECILDI